MSVSFYAFVGNANACGLEEIINSGESEKGGEMLRTCEARAREFVLSVHVRRASDMRCFEVWVNIKTP